MKTNSELLSRLSIWLFIIYFIVYTYIDGCKGFVTSIITYLLLIILFNIFLIVTKNYDNFIYWLEKYLNKVKIFGLTFKWFSKW